MILVKPRSLALLSLLSALSIGSIAWGGWYLLTQSAEFTPEAVKFWAENLLLAGIVFGLTVLMLGGFLALRSIHFTRALERLARMSKNGSFSPEEGLRGLGSAGGRIADILGEMNRMSEKKSLKIAALHSLADDLVSSRQGRSLVCSAVGTVLYASDELISEAGIERRDAIGKNCDAVFPGYGLAAAVEAAFRGERGVTEASGRFSIRMTLNYRKEPVFALCEFRHSVRVEAVAAAVKNGQNIARMTGKKLVEGVSGFFSGFRKGKK